jgi:hypothetical protein
VAKKDVRTLVEEYRQLTADGDPYLEGEDVLAKIVRAKDPAAVELLLTLYPTDGEWNGDERNEVVSALENMPAKRYVPEFARLAARVCRDTPALFDALSVWVIARHLPAFLKALPPLSAEDRDRMLARIEQRHRVAWAAEPAVPTEVAERHERVVAHLRDTRTA